MEIDECATLEFFPFAAFVVLGSAIGSKFPFLKDRSRKSHIFSSPSFLFGWVEGWHLFSLHAVLRINTSVIFLCLSLLFWCLLVQKSFVWSPKSKLPLFLLLVVASSLEWGRQVVTNLHFNQLYSFLLQFTFSLREGLTWLWLTRNFLCRPDGPWMLRSTYVCLLSVGTRGVLPL